MELFVIGRLTVVASSRLVAPSCVRLPVPFSVLDEKSSEPFAETVKAPFTVMVRTGVDEVSSVCVPLAPPSARLATLGFVSTVTV